MKILNWFPRRVTVTELSLLSKYEIICYIAFFLFFIGIYLMLLRIPVKNIEIELADLNNPALYKNNKYGSVCEININLPLTDLLSSETPNYSYKFYRDTIQPYFYKMYDDVNVNKEEVTYSNISKLDFFIDSLAVNKNYLDSLLQNFRKANKGHEHSPLFYHSVKNSMNNIRIGKSYDHEINKIQNGIIYPGHEFVDNSLFHIEMGMQSFSKSGAIKETNGVLSNPFLFDLHDISQSYYRIHLKSQLVDIVYLKFNSIGAYEVSCLDEKPESIDAEGITYCFNENFPGKGIDKIITIFVKSKEFEVKQSSRVFACTSVISALISISLAFIVIYVYRKYRYRFMTKNRRSIEKIVTHSKANHRKYKSRKNNI